MKSYLKVDIELEDVKSAYINFPFDRGKVLLEKEGYRIISIEEAARLQIQLEKFQLFDRDNTLLIICGNLVKEALIRLPFKKGLFITKKSPIMANPEDATDCHRIKEDYELTKDQVEESLSDSIELKDKFFSVSTSIRTDSYKYILSEKFDDNPITNFIFGKYAKTYGEFLTEKKINKMIISRDNVQIDKPIILTQFPTGLPRVGVEPTSLAAEDFKSSAYANSATWASSFFRC